MGPDRSILIVGGGIAGLALARALRVAGLQSEIVEVTNSWAPVGAGITLSVNAMRVMRGLGIAERLEQRGHTLGEMAITDARDRVLGRTDLAALEPRFGKSVAIHRAALHEELLASIPDTKIRLACTVSAIEERGDEGVHVRFSDGDEGRYALVVGADGLRSRVRQLVFGEVPIRYSGYTCWRLVVPTPHGLYRAREMWGRGVRFGSVPIGDDRVYCFAVANAPEGEADPEAGRVERFRERFAAFGGPVPEIVARVERPEQLIHNDLCEVEQRAWHRGRVVLIGDAAHAMTPNMGQGAAMALEDAAVLAELLAAASDERAYAEALPALVARRESRVRWVQSQSRRIGRVAQWQNPILCSLRNMLARLTPDSATQRALVQMAEQPI